MFRGEQGVYVMHSQLSFSSHTQTHLYLVYLILYHLRPLSCLDFQEPLVVPPLFAKMGVAMLRVFEDSRGVSPV